MSVFDSEEIQKTCTIAYNSQINSDISHKWIKRWSNEISTVALGSFEK